MAIKPSLVLLLLIALSLVPLSGRMAHAQTIQPDKPVMQSVFFNVFWGAASGALIGAASASMASKEKENPSKLRETMVQGATLGSVAGLGVGIWLIFNGITFDPDRSLLFGGATPFAQADPGLDLFPPIIFLAEGKNPNRITGIKALVLDLRF